MFTTCKISLHLWLSHSPVTNLGYRYIQECRMRIYMGKKEKRYINYTFQRQQILKLVFNSFNHVGKAPLNLVCDLIT